jgi:hypothetical protein
VPENVQILLQISLRRISIPKWPILVHIGILEDLELKSLVNFILESEDIRTNAMPRVETLSSVFFFQFAPRLPLHVG